MSIRTKRGLLSIIGGLAASLLLFGLFQATSLAATQLVSTIPNDNQIFKNSAVPEQIVLTFDKPLKLEGSLLRVVDPIRSQSDRGSFKVNDKQISVELNKGLAPADYSVEYIAVAADDGSVTQGSYNFRVLPPPGNPLDAGYQFSTATDPLGRNWDIYFPLALVYGIVFLIGAIIANFFYFVGKYRFRANRLNYTMINRTSRNAAIVFSLGVFFFLCRLGNLQPFNARFWLYITVVLLVIFAVRGIIWRLNTYPKAKVEWDELQTKQRRKAPIVEPPLAPVAVVKAVAKTVPAKAISSSSADAGGEDELDTSAVREAASSSETARAAASASAARGLSQRGQKRREKKRERR